MSGQAVGCGHQLHLELPRSHYNTPVSAIWQYNRLDNLTSHIISDTLHDAVVAVGKDFLGFKGTHLICSSDAMQIYLSKCSVYTIMLIGRWSSNTFLWYIRKQMELFSHNVSCQMLTFMSHQHVLDMEPWWVSHLDPCQCNHPNNAKTRKNIGGNMTQWIQLSALAHFALAQSINGGSIFCWPGTGWGWTGSKIAVPNPSELLCHASQSLTVQLMWIFYDNNTACGSAHMRL